MIDISELQLLLALSDNKRLPYLEEEIFASEVHAVMYLRTSRMQDYFGDNDSPAAIVYECARWVLQERWVAAEQVLKDDYYWGTHYCTHFKLDRSQLTKP